MPSSRIEYVDLTKAERALLWMIVFSETTAFLDGNMLPGGGAAQPLEYRLRVEQLTDLVSLLDVIGWEEKEGNCRVYFYPPAVRALRYCKVVVDREEEAKRRADLGELADEKLLLDTILAVVDE